ncbi:hypothetical protein QFC19_008311 [Naganishia cerealis]|uniref:Uncharacterized protein n=1 Tax=Naganishia cerealis TaxID=610337 RepID=A0ACC2V3J2_9TREE|nr:hypothetical protein QFC19_008311 [Naganishia cerealis]
MTFFTSRWRDRETHRHDHAASEHPAPIACDYRPQFRPPVSEPVQISDAILRHYASPASTNSRTSLLCDASANPSIPSYATIEQDVPADSLAGTPQSATKPPSYNPRWERLPGYRDATGVPAHGNMGESWSLRATPPSYWGYGHQGGVVPIATGTGGMFFNSPFQHYPLMDESAIMRNESGGADRFCGMRARRADLVINLSLLVLCLLIWSAVVLSLNLSEPRPGAGSPSPPRVDTPYSAQHDRPTADWDLGMYMPAAEMR